MSRAPKLPVSRHANMVREFHEAFGHPVSDTLTEQTEELRLLRVRLVFEEAIELAEALGVDVSVRPTRFEHRLSVEVLGGVSPDMVEAADALGDLEYVTHGASLVFGIPQARTFEEIHRSNMSKLGEDGKPIYREDGKVLKGPNFSPPDLVRVMRGAGHDGDS